MLSVLMLIRNTRRSAANCLQSLSSALQSLGLAQTTQIIVIDDASDPQHGITPLLRDFRQSTGLKVTILGFTQRQHYSRGLALGLSLATGQQVLFVSHDMILTPSYLRTLLAVSALSPAYGLVRGTSTYVDCFPQHVVVPPIAPRSLADVVAFSEFIERTQGLWHVEDRLLTGDSMLIRREVLEKIGVFDPRYFGYFGDIDFGLRLQRAGFKMVCAKGAWLLHEGAAYYKDESQTTQTDMSLVHARRMQVVQDAYALFREKWDPALPVQYPGADALELERLRTADAPAGGDYQPPLKPDPTLVEFR